MQSKVLANTAHVCFLAAVGIQQSQHPRVQKNRIAAI